MGLVFRILVAASLVGFYVLAASAYRANGIAATDFVCALITVSCGGYVLWNNPRSPLNQAFFFFSLCVSLFISTVGLAYAATAWGVGALKQWVPYLRNGNLLAPAAIMLFIYRFEQPRNRLLLVFTWAALITMLPFVILNAAGEYITDYHLLGDKYVPAGTAAYKANAIVTSFWLITWVAHVAMRAARPSTGRQRPQFVLLLIGCVPGVITAMLGYLPAFNKPWFPSFLGIAIAVFPLTIAYAILRFSLFDIKIVIRRTLPYAAGTAMIGGLYALSLLGLKELGANLDVLPRGANWAALLLLMGLGFQPILEALQKGLDRLFFREDAALEQFLVHAGTRYAAVTTEADIARFLAADAVSALHLEGAAVLLGDDKIKSATAEGKALTMSKVIGLPMPEEIESGKPVISDETGVLHLGQNAETLAAALSRAGIRIVVPFRADRTRGLLAANERLSHAGTTSRDAMFLAALTAQAGIVLGRIHARESAAAAEHLTEAVFESMTNGVALVDGGGIIRDHNPAFEQAFGPCRGKTLEQAGFPVRPSTIMNSGPREVGTPKGTYLVNARSLGEGKDGASVLLVLTDITDLRRLQSADHRRASLAEIGAAISSINHEVGNILSPVGYYLNRAEKLCEPGDVKKAIVTIRQRMEMLNDLSRDLRDYYKEPSLSPKSVLLKNVVESVVADLAGTIETGWSPPEMQGLDVNLQADPQRLKQVLHNILKNAWEAMIETPVKRWAVSAAQSGENARILIADSGCGMEPQTIQHIFEPFFTTKKECGTGLGLAIVKRITEAHGAEIAVESELGKGTSLALTWPLASTSSA
jgi:signal transduction histidine kinase